MDLERTLDAIAAAHHRLLGSLASLDDVAARRPSRLPGWSVGHVLTHLARNADGLIRGFEGAARGEVWARYPGGDEQRAADIEAGANRPPAELVTDVTTASARFEEAAADAAARGWVGSFRGDGDSKIPITELPHKRWREVECHTADLDLGYSYADWPDDYCVEELRRSADVLGPPPAAVAALPLTDQAAWVMGRLDVAGVAPPAQWY